jgi:hypothetical protein
MLKQIFIAFFLIGISVNVFSQDALIRFGKTQKFKPLHKETEKKITPIAYKAYSKLFIDSMEVPLNRYFESDSLLVFIGVSFKYNIEKLFSLLSNFDNPVTKVISPKKDFFFIQGYCAKAFVNRYAYYSKKDKLTYIVNYTFAANKKMELADFEKIINQTIIK